MATASFRNNIVFFGCGSVTQCTLPVLLEQVDVPPRNITVVDMVDNRHRITTALAKGVKYQQTQITPDNLDATLSSLLQPGDICMDLAWNLDTMVLLAWCRDHGVRYLNTSVEVWDPYDDAAMIHPIDRTLYVRHMAMRRMIASWPANNGASAVVEHGANPGLVSHLTKQSLLEIGEATLTAGLVAGERRMRIEEALADEAFNLLAQALDVRVIHIAERDTQLTALPKRVNEFVNTWSIDGLYEEAVAPAELGWGTHERRLPAGAFQHAGHGPGNQIALAEMGCKVRVRSRVPSGEIVGMVIRHGEAFTICDHLTVNGDAGAVYRPTVHYAYCLSDSAIASMYELEMRNYDLQADRRILNDDVLSGRDELGVLLMGHPFKSWWTGSLLSIEEARRCVPGQSATTVQVASSVVGAVVWMIENPNEGIRVPDELPWRRVLEVAKPYLGECWSGPIDWDPLQNRFDIFGRYATRSLDLEDPWQFTNFLV